jgi:hypothetical protein
VEEKFRPLKGKKLGKSRKTLFENQLKLEFPA